MKIFTRIKKSIYKFCNAIDRAFFADYYRELERLNLKNALYILNSKKHLFIAEYNRYASKTDYKVVDLYYYLARYYMADIKGMRKDYFFVVDENNRIIFNTDKKDIAMLKASNCNYKIIEKCFEV